MNRVPLKHANRRLKKEGLLKNLKNLIVEGEK